VPGQAAGALLHEAVTAAPRGTTCGSTHSYQFVAPNNDAAKLRFFCGGQWAKFKSQA
jgi:hypothetical protein